MAFSRGAAWAMKFGLAPPKFFCKGARNGFSGFNNAEQLVHEAEKEEPRQFTGDPHGRRKE